MAQTSIIALSVDEAAKARDAVCKVSWVGLPVLAAPCWLRVCEPVSANNVQPDCSLDGRDQGHVPAMSAVRGGFFCARRRCTGACSSG